MSDVLRKLKYSVDKESLEQIYFSFIKNTVEYGCHICDNCGKGDKKKLEDFELSIGQTVTGARKRTSHELISNELNWPSLPDRTEGVKLKNFLKIMSNEMLQYLQTLIPEKISTKRSQSRNHDNFQSMRARIEIYRTSFIPSSVRLYNSLPIADRSLEYVNSLKKRPCLSLFYCGSRSSGIRHAQLRRKCSKLNFHLFFSACCGCTCMPLWTRLQGLKPLLVTMSIIFPS